MKNSKYIFTLVIYLLFFSWNTFAQDLADTVLAGTSNKMYMVKLTPGSTYAWECKGGDILLGQGTNRILVNWSKHPGKYKISIRETNFNGCIGEPVHLNVVLKAKGSELQEFVLNVCQNENLYLNAPNNLFYKTSNGYFTNSIAFRATEDRVLPLFKVSNNEAIDSTVQRVFVNEIPKANFDFNQNEYLLNESINVYFKNSKNDLVEWVLNDSLKIKGNYLNIPLTKLGLNKLQLIVQNASGCVDSLQKEFYVKKIEGSSIPAAEAPEIKFPTIFSPNKDGVNDYLRAFTTNQQLIKEFSLNIFDRWGALMYTTFDPNFEWNGTHKGDELADGIYVLNYSGSFTTGAKFEGTKKVTLNR